MFDLVEMELARNLYIQRLKNRMSQRKFADALTDKSGKQISDYTVSAWERCMSPIPAAIMPSITDVLGCSSYDMYPHSQKFEQRDVRLLESIRGKPERIKQILDFMINRWDGDDEAFWEFGLLYFVLDKHYRKYIAQVGIEHYLDTLENDPLSIDDADGLTVDVHLLKRATKALDHEY